MRRAILLLLLLSVLFAPGVAGGVESTSPRVRLAGVSGTTFEFATKHPVLLNNAGSDTRLRSASPWTGIIVARTDATQRLYLDWYMRLEIHEKMLCPGASCEPPWFAQPTVGGRDDNDGHYVLRPGRYIITLLGAPGSRVAVNLGFGGLATAPRVTRADRPAAVDARVHEGGVSLPGNDIASRGFVRYPDNGALQVDMTALGFYAPDAAVFNYNWCVTAGGERTFDEVGGAAPCADHSGQDFMSYGAPYVFDNVGGSIAGIGSLTSAGRNDPGVGIGWEAQVAAAGGSIAPLSVAVQIPTV